ncbi:divergent polysaccharide deacetylase family protein [Thalassospiraceae bacterium LMO-JJ14]|nr:divergent polysaccharide deacetylase family protein [Thalassospiraceae bacterium LMO-JJ14]
MALLIVMALGGLFGGYYLGKEVAPAPKTIPAENPPATSHPPDAGHSIYEESLPRDIIIESGGILKRIGLPEPDGVIDLGNGTKSALQPETAKKPDETEQPSDKGISAPPSEASQQPVTDDTAVKQPPPVETARLPDTRPEAALPANIAELQRARGESLPAWQRYALPVTRNGKPAIVIVIDDLGLDRRRARRMVALPGPLTLSFMSYAEDLQNQATQARKAGHELMLHVPMEPGSAKINPGPNVLLSGMPRDELLKNVTWNLEQMSGYVGINNHMGSRFTSDAGSMKIVVAALKERGYLFLDSVTSGQSVAHETARDGGIPFAVRNVFLDHEDDLEEIRTQLRHTEQIARKTGLAIAIGHPRDNTIEALKSWLPTLKEKGFQLVPISSVVRVKAD